MFRVVAIEPVMCHLYFTVWERPVQTDKKQHKRGKGLAKQKDKRPNSILRLASPSFRNIQSHTLGP